MSKFISEIIKDIKTNPTNWMVLNASEVRHEEFHISGPGLTNGEVRILNHGNPRFAAIESVYIKGESIPFGYIDRWRLHMAIKRWFQKASLQHLTSKPIIK